MLPDQGDMNKRRVQRLFEILALSTPYWIFLHLDDKIIKTLFLYSNFNLKTHEHRNGKGLNRKQWTNVHNNNYQETSYNFDQVRNSKNQVI